MNPIFNKEQEKFLSDRIDKLFTLPKIPAMKLKVYYGYTKLTRKLIKKRELAIIFENDYSYKNEAAINRIMHVAYTRDQTNDEIEDINSIRMFSKYSYMIDDRKFKGNIDAVLIDNYNADIKHISPEELQMIGTKLRELFYQLWPKG